MASQPFLEGDRELVTWYSAEMESAQAAAEQVTQIATGWLTYN